MITYTHSQLLHALQTCKNESDLAQLMSSILQQGGDPNGTAPVPVLVLAAQTGRTGAIEAFKRARANMDIKDNRGWSAAMHAAARGDEAFLRALHQCGADLVQDRLPDGRTLLQVAARAPASLIQFLLEIGVAPAPNHGHDGAATHLRDCENLSAS